MAIRMKYVKLSMDPDLYQKLEEFAKENNRALANAATLLVENALYPGGRRDKPDRPRNTNWGGKRKGSGRKPKAPPEQTETGTPEPGQKKEFQPAIA